MASGILAVRVFASQAQLPIQGASVIVTQRGEGEKQRLLAIHRTDESGMVPPLRLSVPERQESTHPQEERPAFAHCTVWVEHPDYAMLRMDGVQVFAGQTTWQDVELIPLGGDGSSLEQGSIRDVSAQDL